jgi:hypothetical protein
MTRVKRFSKDDWKIGVYDAILLDTPERLRRRDLKRVQRKRRKSVRAYGNPPLLNKAWRMARAWIQKYGWRESLMRAQRMRGRAGALMHRIMWRISDENAVKPGPAPAPRPKPKPKRVVVTAKMYERLLEEFGTSDAMAVRGFILENGECLNLGQYDDHRIINCVYTDSEAAEAKFGSRYGAFANLCRKFNMIRWMPENKSVEIFVPTTRDQDRTIMDLADAGMLREAEVHRPRGGTVMLEAEDGETLVRGINAILG